MQQHSHWQNPLLGRDADVRAGLPFWGGYPMSARHPRHEALVRRNRRIAEAALRPWTPVFTHGDLQITHVFVDGDEITGVIDWSEAGPGDALYDLAILTLGHEEHLGDVTAS